MGSSNLNNFQNTTEFRDNSSIPFTPTPSIRFAQAFHAAFSSGAAGFLAATIVILLKLLIVRAGSVPAIDYDGLYAPLLALLQNLLLTPGFVAIVAMALTAASLGYEKLIACGRWEAIFTCIAVATSFSLGLTPLVHVSDSINVQPLLVGMPIVATLVVVAMSRWLFLRPGIVCSAAIPAGYLFFKMTDLLADTGVAAAFPITFEFISHDLSAMTTFVAGLNMFYLITFVIAAHFLAVPTVMNVTTKVINFSLCILSLWLTAFLDFLMERLDAFPSLMNFRFGL
jgi:hypothetical protein